MTTILTFLAILTVIITWVILPRRSEEERSAEDLEFSIDMAKRRGDAR